MNFEFKNDNFSGPMEKLLALIEEKKMEITELNLAAVTADFLNYLHSIEETHPRMLADFVVVASRLLLIKSKALLPNLELSKEEEKELKDFESQLRFYQEFKPAINHIRQLWEVKNFSTARQFMASRPVIFYPSENISVLNLKNAISAVFETLNQFVIETKTIKSPLVSLEEKIEELVGFFAKAISNKNNSKEKTESINFKELNKEKNKSEIIVMFLAVLHLIQRQIVKVEQNKEFSDIILIKFNLWINRRKLTIKIF